MTAKKKNGPDSEKHEAAPPAKSRPKPIRRVILPINVRFDVAIPDSVKDSDKVDYASRKVEALIEALNNKKGDILFSLDRKR